MKAGRDLGPPHTMSETRGESRMGSEEIMPPRTSLSGPKLEPQVGHAFTIIISLFKGYRQKEMTGDIISRLTEGQKHAGDCSHCTVVGAEGTLGSLVQG